MTVLKAHINQLDFSKELIYVKNLLDSAIVTVTFWGNRTVHVNGIHGSVDLVHLVKKVLAASYERRDAEDLSPSERIAGIGIAKDLQLFYDITDSEISKSNFVTRFFVWMREFSSSLVPYTPRFYLEQTVDENFRTFSGAQFQRYFPHRPGYHPSCGDITPHSRVLVTEDWIRSLRPR
jgi:hypothetical protein